MFGLDRPEITIESHDERGKSSSIFRRDHNRDLQSIFKLCRRASSKRDAGGSEFFDRRSLRQSLGGHQPQTVFSKINLASEKDGDSFTASFLKEGLPHERTPALRSATFPLYLPW